MKRPRVGPGTFSMLVFTLLVGCYVAGLLAAEYAPGVRIAGAVAVPAVAFLVLGVVVVAGDVGGSSS